jgi:hypothetical protein
MEMFSIKHTKWLKGINSHEHYFSKTIKLEYALNMYFQRGTCFHQETIKEVGRGLIIEILNS